MRLLFLFISGEGDTFLRDSVNSHLDNYFNVEMQHDKQLIAESRILLDSQLKNILVQMRSTAHRRANAVVVILCRNTDLQGIRRTLQNFESIFNKKFGYPYVFLNDKPFTERFKNSIRKMGLSGGVEFGLIPAEHWSYPAWIDQQRAKRSREEYVKNDIIYGGIESYRHMCRFNSGFFFRHPLLSSYDYYWRIEPDVKFFCTLNYDPFLFMQKNGKIYGFNIALGEIPSTITTLWETTLDFIRNNVELVRENANMLEFFMKPNGAYNLCHFWSNFEIADLRFWRSPPYLKYFDWLDRNGGFFYERWGDAPVHSLAVGMFLRPDQVHFFDDIGYLHSPFMHCPPSNSCRKCTCNSLDTFDWSSGSCLRRYLTLYKSKHQQKGC